MWNKLTKSLGISWNKNVFPVLVNTVNYFLLKEDGCKLLQENGDRILLETDFVVNKWNKITKSIGISWKKI